MSEDDHHQVVCFGETFWHIRRTGKQLGGTPVNVGYHLQMLGMNPAIVSRIGYDQLGRQLIESLEAKNMCTEYFQMDDRKATGMVTAYNRQGQDIIYNIQNDAAWDNIEFTQELSELVSKARYFIFGSLAVRCADTCQTLMKLLPFAKTKVFNMNLSAPFYNRGMVEMLLVQADIVKLSQAELELITGWFSNYKHETDRIKLLQEKFEVPDIVVNKERKGSVWISNNTVYEHSGFATACADDKINGDAFLAGLLLRLSLQSLPDKALEYANATGAVAASYSEPYPRYHPLEIDALLNPEMH